ncbi:MAG: VOC family protein [Clostridiales bacterium]|jgi:lactoylglutathione lyase|nr:VOC family protein [Clostridiales bacterium]
MIESKMIHVNFHVTDLQASLEFYNKALGLKEVRRHAPDHGEFVLVYLRGKGEFELELTWNRDKVGKYELGDNETHLAFCVQDYAQAHSLHQEMGCISYDNLDMGIYFITDPDNHWLEMLPSK